MASQTRPPLLAKRRSQVFVCGICVHMSIPRNKFVWPAQYRDRERVQVITSHLHESAWSFMCKNTFTQLLTDK